jgi:hypothetical protein
MIVALLAAYGWHWITVLTLEELRWFVIVGQVPRPGTARQLVAGVLISRPLGAKSATAHKDLVNWPGERTSLLHDSRTAAKQSSVVIPLLELRLRSNGGRVLYMHWHRKRVALGDSANVNLLFAQRSSELTGLSRPAIVSWLREWEVRCRWVSLKDLLTTGERLPDDIAPHVLYEFEQQSRLKLVEIFDQIRVFRLYP